MLSTGEDLYSVVEYVRRILGKESEVYTGKSRNHSSKVKDLVPELPSLETCRGVFSTWVFFSVILVTMQNDRIHTVDGLFVFKWNVIM